MVLGLGTYLQIMQAFYRSEGFGEEFRHSTSVGSSVRVPVTAEVDRAVKESEYLQFLFDPPK